MLSRVVVVFFISVGFSTAFTENDWKDAVIEVYSKLTKNLNQKNFGSELQELFEADSEELWPGLSLMRKEGLLLAEDRWSVNYLVKQLYIAFIELLFSSSDVAIVKNLEYDELVDGSQQIFNGLDMFVRNGTDVKIKLHVFNVE